MATADQYAAWIVANADKKGTPEFNIVVQAYQEAKQEETPAPKQGGFFDSLKEGITTLGSAPEAAKFAAGREGSREELIADQQPGHATTAFADINSVGSLYDWASQIAGGSLGALVAPGTGAAIASALSKGPGPAKVVGAGLLGAQYLTENLGRQASTQQQAIEAGEAPDATSLGKAAGAAAGQTALDVAGFHYFKPLFSKFPIVGKLLGTEGDDVTKATVAQLVDALKNGKLRIRNGVASGVGKGIAFEVPQEIAQQALERWQAGLSLTDEDAKREFIESAAGAMLLGGFMGAPSGALDMRGKIRTAEEEVQRRDRANRPPLDLTEPPSSDPVTELTPEPTVATTPAAPVLTGLDAIKVREQLWNSYSKGDTTFNGAEDPLLVAAKAAKVDPKDKNGFLTFAANYMGYKKSYVPKLSAMGETNLKQSQSGLTPEELNAARKVGVDIGAIEDLTPTSEIKEDSYKASLDAKFAKGEITEKEYKDRLADIEDGVLFQLGKKPESLADFVEPGITPTAATPLPHQYREPSKLWEPPVAPKPPLPPPVAAFELSAPPGRAPELANMEGIKRKEEYDALLEVLRTSDSQMEPEDQIDWEFSKALREMPVERTVADTKDIVAPWMIAMRPLVNTAIRLIKAGAPSTPAVDQVINQYMDLRNQIKNTKNRNLADIASKNALWLFRNNAKTISSEIETYIDRVREVAQGKKSSQVGKINKQSVDLLGIITPAESRKKDVELTEATELEYFTGAAERAYRLGAIDDKTYAAIQYELKRRVPKAYNVRALLRGMPLPKAPLSAARKDLLNRYKDRATELYEAHKLFSDEYHSILNQLASEKVDLKSINKVLTIAADRKPQSRQQGFDPSIFGEDQGKVVRGRKKAETAKTDADAPSQGGIDVSVPNKRIDLISDRNLTNEEIEAITAEETKVRRPKKERVEELRPEETLGYVGEETGYDEDAADDPQYRRAKDLTGGKPIGVAEIQKVVGDLLRGLRNAPEAVILQDANDSKIPAELKGTIPADVNGFTFVDKVYILANNAMSAASVRGTLFHEILGHYGLRQAFGAELNTLLTNIYASNPRVRSLAKAWLAANPDIYKDRGVSERRKRAVEEVLAEASETGTVNKRGLRAAINNIIALIRNYLRKKGWVTTFSDNDVAQILSQAHRAIMYGPPPANTVDSVRYQVAAAGRRVDSIGRHYTEGPEQTEGLMDRALNAASVLPDDLRKAMYGTMNLYQLGEMFKKVMPAISELYQTLGRRANKLLDRRHRVEKNAQYFFRLANRADIKPYMADFNELAHRTTIDQVEFYERHPNTNELLVGADGKLILSNRMRTLLKQPLNKTAAEDLTAKELIDDFSKFPPELQDAYNKLRQEYEHYSADFLKMMTENLDSKNSADRLRAEFMAKKINVYLPLFREGRYWLSFQDKNNETVKALFPSPRERDAFRAEMTKRGGKDFKPYSKDVRFSHSSTPPTGFLKEVVDSMKKNGVADEAIDMVYETYLDYLPTGSVMSLYRPRDQGGILGFSRDAFANYAKVAQRMANNLSNAEFMNPIEDHISEMVAQAGNITDPKISQDAVMSAVRNIKDQVEFLRSPEVSTLAHKASYWSYMFFLAGNPSSAIVNMTQVPVVVAPLLAGKYGFGNASTALNYGYSTYFKLMGRDPNGNDSPDYTFGASLDERIKKAHGAEKQELTDLKGLFDALIDESVVHSTEGSQLIEMQRAGTGNYTGTRAWIERKLNFMFQNSERANREITALAAYKAARAGSSDGKVKPMSHLEAIREAINITNDSHGASLIEANPKFFQKGFGRVMFVFKRHPQAMIYLLSRLFHDSFKGADPEMKRIARNQLMGIMGTSFAIAGVMGMPLVGAATLLAQLLFDWDDDEPLDIDEWIKAQVGDTMYKGPVSAMLGADISKRTGFNNMIWRDDPRRLAEIGPILYAVEQAGGPAYGILSSIVRGSKQVADGQTWRGVETMTPAAIRNSMKAVRLATEGAMTKDGKPIVEDVTAYEAFMQVLGFNPLSLSQATARASVVSKFKRKLEDRRGALLNKANMAWDMGDVEGYNDVMEKIAKFNKANPTPPLFISNASMRRSYKEHVRRIRESVDGVYIPSKLRRQIEEDLWGTADEEP